MTENLEKQHIEYHIAEITRTAKRLQSVILKKNNMPLNPTSGSEIKPLPVFEPEQYSLLEFTQTITDATIVWPETESTFLPAYVIKYCVGSTNSAKIVVTANENYCEARLLAAKELMHCHIIDNGLSTTKTLPDVNDLLDSLALGVSLDNQTMVDQIAWWGASEFLIPEGWVPILREIFSEIKTKLPQHDAILHMAQLLRVPAGLIKFKLRLL